MALNNVPVTGQSLGASRDLINQNFSVIDTAFTVNHVPYNDGSGNQGFHKFINIPAGTPTGVTNNGTAQVALYSNTGSISGVPELFFQRNNLGANSGYSISECTANSPGWTRLPSGILLKWQTNISFSGSSSKNVNFSSNPGPAFTNLFTVLITPLSSVNFDHVLAISSVALSNFTVSVQNGSSAPSTTLFAYLAIGI